MAARLTLPVRTTEPKERGHFTVSGFVSFIEGVYFWTTAGHCLRDLDREISKGNLRVYEGAFGDAYAFMRDVRRLDTTSGGTTPAVALTAFARSEDRTRAMIAGYQVHVAKPIEPQELIATVASLAGRMNSGRD